MEFYKKYRPKVLKNLLGQPEAVKMLQGLLKKKTLPHAILIHGPSGCGKTTVARILKTKLNCSDMDFNEMNCADMRGVDTPRDIRRQLNLAPVAGDCRVWLIDEAHQLTKDAQDAFLKMLEDTPRHVYFILATTEPAKLRPTIRTRCTEIKMVALQVKVMEQLINNVCEKEKLKISEDVMDRLVQVADGSARKALVLLHQISEMEDEEDQLESILSSNCMRQSIDLARALISPRAQWADVAKILKELDEDAESLRRMILGYAGTVLLGGGKLAPWAYTLIRNFEGNFYDGGKASLIAACYGTIVDCRENK